MSYEDEVVRQRINLNIDVDVVRAYKALSRQSNEPYTTIIREVLKRYLPVEQKLRDKRRSDEAAQTTQLLENAENE